MKYKGKEYIGFPEPADDICRGCVFYLTDDCQKVERECSAEGIIWKLKEESVEWKELEKDNLPPDILTGDYEFKYGDKFSGDGNIENNPNATPHRRLNIIYTYMGEPNGGYVHYRERQPKAPTQNDMLQRTLKILGAMDIEDVTIDREFQDISAYNNPPIEIGRTITIRGRKTRGTQ